MGIAFVQWRWRIKRDETKEKHSSQKTFFLINLKSWIVFITSYKCLKQFQSIHEHMTKFQLVVTFPIFLLQLNFSCFFFISIFLFNSYLYSHHEMCTYFSFCFLPFCSMNFFPHHFHFLYFRRAFLFFMFKAMNDKVVRC